MNLPRQRIQYIHQLFRRGTLYADTAGDSRRWVLSESRRIRDGLQLMLYTLSRNKQTTTLQFPACNQAFRGTGKTKVG